MARTIDDYVAAAKTRQGFTTDKELARALGKSPATISHMLSDSMPPGPEMLIDLARLGGIPLDEAKADLIRWKSEKTARSIERAFARAIGRSAAVFALAFCATVLNEPLTARAHIQADTAERPANIATGAPDDCILWKIIRLLRRLARRPQKWRQPVVLRAVIAG